MANLVFDLNKFKAAGVYTVEYSTSESRPIATDTLRLVVGFSRQGIFNTPVYLDNVNTSRKIFGNIDPILEKRGSFFHRSIETCLQQGPVLALNLMPLNNDPNNGDMVEYKSFSLSPSQDNSCITKELLSSFYNKERFWFLDNSNFHAIVNNHINTKDMLISFVNVGQRPVSLIVKKSDNVSGFNITAREYFGNGNVPDYIKDYDYISDYFIDVIIVNGDWTNYDNLSIDPYFAKYFNNNGIKIDKLNNFLSDNSVNVIATITGCIIPDFIDGNGVNRFIETLVNNESDQTGIFMTVNRDMIDDYVNSIYKIDMVGHSLVDSDKSALNFLSYNSPIMEEIIFNTPTDFSNEESTITYSDNDFNNNTIKISSIPYENDASPFFNTFIIPKPMPNATVFTLEKYNNLVNSITKNTLIKTYGSGNSQYLKVSDINNTGLSLELTLTNPDKNSNNAGIYNAIFDNADETNKKFSITNTNTSLNQLLNQFDIIYVKGTNKYFVVKDVIISSPNIDIEIYSDENDLINDLQSSNYYLKNYINYVSYNFNVNEIDNKEGYICIISDHKNYIPDLTNNTLTYIINPSLIKFDNTNEVIEIYNGNNLYKQLDNGTIVNGDFAYTNSSLSSRVYLSFSKTTGKYGLDCYKAKEYSDINLTALANPFVSSFYCLDGSQCNNGICIQTGIGNIKEYIPIIPMSLNNLKTKFKISATDNNKINVNSLLVCGDINEKHLTRVISKTKSVNSNGIVEYEISVNEPIFIENISGKDCVCRYLPINDFAKNLQFTKLEGFKITSYHMPGGENQLWKIYGVLENTNLSEVLSDKNLIDFRYIVDTFDGGLEPQCGAKSILSRLAKKRQTCLALLNLPSISKFMASTDPMFTDMPDIDNGNPKPVLKVEYIASGGNLSMAPSFKFTLPDDENGSKYSGFFTPFLKIREDNKIKYVPPAADVSNNFIRKFQNGIPYDIVAGPKRGVLSNNKLVGLEYDFLKSDRVYLEQMGINAIINDRNYGIMIYGDMTSYQKMLDPLNYLHIRDLGITIEDRIEKILSNYVFDKNDTRIRLEIKTLVDNYLESVKNNGGIYDYITIMNDKNNTTDVIKNAIGIIDVIIEPYYGMNKLINRIQIVSPGQIASGGFYTFT